LLNFLHLARGHSGALVVLIGGVEQRQEGSGVNEDRRLHRFSVP
jgi:hypothetical protein